MADSISCWQQPLFQQARKVLLRAQHEITPDLAGSCRSDTDFFDGIQVGDPRQTANQQRNYFTGNRELASQPLAQLAQARVMDEHWPHYFQKCDAFHTC